MYCDCAQSTRSQALLIPSYDKETSVRVVCIGEQLRYLGGYQSTLQYWGGYLIALQYSGGQSNYITVLRGISSYIAALTLVEVLRVSLSHCTTDLRLPRRHNLKSERFSLRMHSDRECWEEWSRISGQPPTSQIMSDCYNLHDSSLHLWRHSAQTCPVLTTSDCCKRMPGRIAVWCLMWA